MKTTRLLPRLFALIAGTIDNDELAIRHRGLLTVFVDKIVKLLHMALLHPQDYSVGVLSKFFFEKPMVDGQEGYRNWRFLLQMFTVLEENNVTYDLVDVKLSLVRFISELLLQTAHMKDNYLDETIDLKRKDNSLSADFDVSSFDTYGSQLFLEQAKLFKQLYDEGADYESEN